MLLHCYIILKVKSVFFLGGQMGFQVFKVADPCLRGIELLQFQRHLVLGHAPLMFDSYLQSRTADSFPPNYMVTSWTTHGDQVYRKLTVHVDPFGCSQSARTLLPVISALLAYPSGHVTCWGGARRTA